MVIPAAAQTTPDLKARCDQLIAWFDRYAPGRSENSDGVRNHTRIGAGIDCEEGRYETGIKAMEDLLRRKKFTLPPPPAAFPQASLPGAPADVAFATEGRRQRR